MRKIEELTEEEKHEYFGNLLMAKYCSKTDPMYSIFYGVDMDKVAQEYWDKANAILS